MLKMVPLGVEPVSDSLREKLAELLCYARCSRFECTLFVHDGAPYRGEHVSGISGIRVSEQRRAPVPGGPLCVYILIYIDDLCYATYLAPPENMKPDRFLKRLELALAVFEDAADGHSPEEVAESHDFELKPEMLLLSNNPSPRKQLAALKEWQERMQTNIRTIESIREATVQVILQEQDELRRQILAQPPSNGLHQARKKQGRMYRILCAIQKIARKNGDFDPGLALESIHEHVPEESNMSKLRFQKLGTQDKYYRAHRSGPFSLYYITPKGYELLRALAPRDNKSNPRAL